MTANNQKSSTPREKNKMKAKEKGIQLVHEEALLLPVLNVLLIFTNPIDKYLDCFLYKACMCRSFGLISVRFF